jgi:phosphinothricin acetyltransferase
MTVLIRPAHDEDMDAITAIYADAVLNGTASFEIEPPDLKEMSARRAALIEKGFPYLVAERAGRILGYAYAGAYRPRPAYAFTVEDSIYVAPDAQRSGAGRALLAKLISVCEDKGFRQMVAVIGDSLSEPSIGLHQHMGFIHIGTVRNVGFKKGRWLDQVIMQKSLGAGATRAPV